MDFKKRLKEAGLKEKIEYINVISEKLEGYNSVIVGIIPYYAGERESYFSKYTRGKDYHKVSREILEKIVTSLGISDYKIYVDTSPFDERNLALKAGLGVAGKNGLVINEKYGSYVFIGMVLVNLENTYEKSEVTSCIMCGECERRCPCGVIGEKINYERCISEITQKRQLTKNEEEVIIKNKSAWGCDVCQDVCPMNKNKAETPIFEFRENLLLDMDDINDISNKEFKEKYGCYALAYKGRNILKRNINLLNNNS